MTLTHSDVAPDIETPPGEYRCILADPPWLERGSGKVKRGADRHYPLLNTPDIIRVMLTAPQWRPCTEGCHLWLWVTNNFLPDGLHVMKALGFRYVTNAAWAKDRIGLGQYLRGQHEILLFGVRGRLRSSSRSTSSLLGGRQLPRGAHSAKPEAGHVAAEQVSPGPRVEFFARQRRDGWDAFGNEVAS